MRKNSGNILLIILAVIGILAASVGGYFWWISKDQKLTAQPRVEALKPKDVTPLAEPTENWETYVHPILGYSIKYPPTWTLTKSKPENLEQVAISGPQGKITIISGSGFGGGCPTIISIRTSEQVMIGCESPGMEYVVFSKEFDVKMELGPGRKVSSVTTEVRGKIEHPRETNKTAVLKIISTLKFL